MARICQNPDCNKSFSFIRNTKKYCTRKCKEISNNERRKDLYKEWAKNNSIHIKEYKSEYYLQNKERLDFLNKKYRENNKQYLSEKQLEYYYNNKQDRINYIKSWSKNNRKLRNSYEAKRRAIKIKATPKWADLEVIKEFYKNCPKGYHVDHIIPLRGKNVCGLHVIDNLQYLTASENCRKSNKVIL